LSAWVRDNSDNSDNSRSRSDGSTAALYGDGRCDRHTPIVACIIGPVTAEALGRFVSISEEAMAEPWRIEAVSHLTCVLNILDDRREFVAAAHLSGVIALLSGEAIDSVIDQTPKA
jgi:hypothetical protein